MIWTSGPYLITMYKYFSRYAHKHIIIISWWIKSKFKLKKQTEIWFIFYLLLLLLIYTHAHAGQKARAKLHVQRERREEKLSRLKTVSLVPKAAKHCSVALDTRCNKGGKFAQNHNRREGNEGVEEVKKQTTNSSQQQRRLHLIYIIMVSACVCECTCASMCVWVV